LHVVEEGRMTRLLPTLLLLGLSIYALIDCIQTPSDEVRNLPKIGWIALIVVAFIIGPVAWLVAGRPRADQPGTPARPSRTGPPRPSRPSRPVAPDDDPDFLRGIDSSRSREHEDLLRQWEDDLKKREDQLRDGDTDPGEDGPPRS
jgi:hypothetical protein